MTEDLVETIRHAVFTPVRRRDGYDMNDVDDFLERIESSLLAGEPVGPLVDGLRFRPTKYRQGYDPVEVDQFLSYIVSAQSTEERTRAEERARVEVSEDAESAQPPPSPSVPEPRQEPLPSVIEESPGFLSKLKAMLR